MKDMWEEPKNERKPKVSHGGCAVKQIQEWEKQEVTNERYEFQGGKQVLVCNYKETSTRFLSYSSYEYFAWRNTREVVAIDQMVNATGADEKQWTSSVNQSLKKWDVILWISHKIRCLILTEFSKRDFPIVLNVTGGLRCRDADYI